MVSLLIVSLTKCWVEITFELQFGCKKAKTGKNEFGEK